MSLKQILINIAPPPPLFFIRSALIGISCGVGWLAIVFAAVYAAVRFTDSATVIVVVFCLLALTPAIMWLPGAIAKGVKT